MFEESQSPHGEARFAFSEEIRAAGLFGKEGVEFGHYNGRILRHFNRGGMKITGGSGSGKTSQVLIPLILSGAKIVIIFDFKNGEITRVIEPYCALSGIPLHVFDPYEITDFPRTRISLLSHLKANSPQLFLDVKRLWKTLAPDSIGDNSYFDKAARRYGFAITMADIALNGGTSFQAIFALVSMLRGNFQAWSEWAAMAEERTVPSVRDTFNEMRESYSGTPKLFDSTVGVLSNSVSFMNDPRLQETLVGDGVADFVFDEIVGSGPAIFSFVIRDGAVEELAPLLRQSIGSTRIAKQKVPGAAPIILLMDEASRLGSFEELKHIFSMGRGEGVTPVVFYQDDGQIENNLGPTGRTTLEANAAISIDLGQGIRDYQTAQNRSLALGYQTIEVDDPLVQSRAEAEATAIRRDVFLNGTDPLEAAMRLRQLRYEAEHTTKMRKPLMAADELLNLPADQMLVQARGYGLRPFIAFKEPYFTQRRFAGHFFSNPNENRDLKSVKLRTFWGMRRRRIIEAPLPAHLDHLPQYAGGARPFRYVEGFKPKP